MEDNNIDTVPQPEKTIAELLNEKRRLENIIKDEIEYFLKQNPNVRWVSFDSSVNEIEMRCGIIKEFSLVIKIEL